MWLLILVLICLLVYVVKISAPLIVERRQARNLLKCIDGPHPHWLFGHLNELSPSEDTILEAARNCFKYPKIGQLWFGPLISYLMLFHPHVLKRILNANEPKDDMAYRFIRPWIGDGLLVSHGQKWLRNRRLLTRAFHFDVLKQYVKVFDACAGTLVKKWDDLANGKPKEIFRDVSLLTLDSMLKCAISYESDCQVKGSNRYISSVYDLTTIAMNRIFNPLCHNDFIFSLTSNGRKFKAACDFIHEFDEQVIRNRKNSLKQLLNVNDISFTSDDMHRIEKIRRENGQWLDFLDILLLTRDEDGRGLSDREVRDEVDTFLFEGHDTTASGISWTFYCLATYPQYQEKCREEIRRELGDKHEIEWSDLPKLTYLTMFIKEVLRLYPPVFAIARRTRNPIEFGRGFGKDQHCLADKPEENNNGAMTIQPPHNIGIPLLVLHRNETVWNDPAVFNPERFVKKQTSKRSPYAYLPFSAGPRNCIGQNFAMNEMKVVVAKILQNYCLRVDSDCSEPEMMPMIVLKSTNGINIKIDKLY